MKIPIRKYLGETSVEYYFNKLNNLTKKRKMSMRQFDWGGRLQKSNVGVQRLVDLRRDKRRKHNSKC